jgi:hypothetical protein
MPESAGGAPGFDRATQLAFADEPLKEAIRQFAVFHLGSNRPNRPLRDWVADLTEQVEAAAGRL